MSSGVLSKFIVQRFSNSLKPLRKLPRKTLGVKVDDTLSSIFSEDGVQVLGTGSVSVLAGILACNSQAIVPVDAMRKAILQGAFKSGN